MLDEQTIKELKKYALSNEEVKDCIEKGIIDRDILNRTCSVSFLKSRGLKLVFYNNSCMVKWQDGFDILFTNFHLIIIYNFKRYDFTIFNPKDYEYMAIPLEKITDLKISKKPYYGKNQYDVIIKIDNILITQEYAIDGVNISGNGKFNRELINIYTEADKENYELNVDKILMGKAIELINRAKNIINENEKLKIVNNTITSTSDDSVAKSILGYAVLGIVIIFIVAIFSGGLSIPSGSNSKKPWEELGVDKKTYMETYEYIKKHSYKTTE